jgi:hypothetical protein
MSNQEYGIVKITLSIIGFFSGKTFTLSINWEHIAERTIETVIIGLAGGIAGAIGGLIVAYFIKKFKLGKYFHK